MENLSSVGYVSFYFIGQSSISYLVIIPSLFFLLLPPIRKKILEPPEYIGGPLNLSIFFRLDTHKGPCFFMIFGSNNLTFLIMSSFYFNI